MPTDERSTSDESRLHFYGLHLQCIILFLVFLSLPRVTSCVLPTVSIFVHPSRPANHKTNRGYPSSPCWSSSS
ncbi:hypothetical protein A4X13_0g6925 [Tilletia indica]|uniref:Uncharacterized protein n=1 Tax=Tilletia indica TaxID=43049 RepID=A0A177T5Y4_9BASI|nr:hypothetical protein A4X13_0g6925 [Tilletia indica]